MAIGSGINVTPQSVITCEKLLNMLLKVPYSFLLVSGFNGTWAYFSDHLYSFISRYFPLLHQVARQHGPCPSMAMHTMDTHTLQWRSIQLTHLLTGLY